MTRSPLRKRARRPSLEASQATTPGEAPRDPKAAPQVRLRQPRIPRSLSHRTDLAHLLSGAVAARAGPTSIFHQDIPHGLHNGNIHIYSPIHDIPAADGHFDGVICNEHVANPVEVVREIDRVLRPGGVSLSVCPLPAIAGNSQGGITGVLTSRP